MKVLNSGKKIYIVQICYTSDPGGDTLTSQIEPLAVVSPDVVLDLCNEDLNSLGLGSLVNILNIYRETWKDKFENINLINVSDRTTKLLKLSNLDRYFNEWNNLEDYYKTQK